MKRRSMQWPNSSYPSTLKEAQGGDFLDGGEGNDSLFGFGKNNVLYGGADNLDFNQDLPE